jgi:hypothetical protein
MKLISKEKVLEKISNLIKSIDEDIRSEPFGEGHGSRGCSDQEIDYAIQMLQIIRTGVKLQKTILVIDQEAS